MGCLKAAVRTKVERVHDCVRNALIGLLEAMNRFDLPEM